MINLLPIEEKKELLLEEYKKLSAIIVAAALICLVCLAFILFSLKIHFLEEVNYQKSILSDLVEKYKSSDFLTIENIIKKYNADIDKLNNFYGEKESFNNVLKIISGIEKPAGLKIENISIRRNEKNEKITEISISGLSNDREILLRFKDSIIGKSGIKNVFFPPDNWIKEKDINFYLTFAIAAEE